jgi:acylphosphatase
MTSDLTQVHVFISGRVQGVGYRLWSVRQAKQLGLNGWVKNIPDGRVEAVFVGEKEALNQMIQLCYSGPHSAQVTKVLTKLEKPQKFTTFEISY